MRKGGRFGKADALRERPVSCMNECHKMHAQYTLKASTPLHHPTCLEVFVNLPNWAQPYARLSAGTHPTHLMLLLGPISSFGKSQLRLYQQFSRCGSFAALRLALLYLLCIAHCDRAVPLLPARNPYKRQISASKLLCGANCFAL